MTNRSRVTLVIDTTVQQCALSVRNADATPITYEWQTNRQLDSIVFSKLTGLLTQSGVALTDVDAIAVNRGPGSFIGSRIGLAVANTFNIIHNIPVCGVSGLAAMAATAMTAGALNANERHLFAAVNCVRSDIFFQTFHLQNGCLEPVETQARSMVFESFIEHVGTAPVLIRGSHSKLTLTEDELSSLPGSMLFDLNNFITHMHHAATLHSNIKLLPQPIYVKLDSVP